MKMKKVLCILLAAVMVLGTAACGKGESNDNAQNAPAEDTSAAENEDAAPDAGESEDAGDSEVQESAGATGTLKVAAVETAYGADMWTEVCAAFEQSHEGVTIELTVDKKLEDVITPEMKSGVYPDVILRAVGAESGLTETFVKDSNLVELTDVLAMTVPGESVTVGDKILPGFVENSICNPYGDGKTYLMPMFYGPCGLFFPKSGANDPLIDGVITCRMALTGPPSLNSNMP